MNGNKRQHYRVAVVLVAAACLLLGVSCVQQKKPRRKVTVKQCLQCHPEYKERYTTGNVHDPVRKGECFACHRPHGIYGKIVFRLQQPDICYTCHAGVKPAEEARSIHKPLQVKSCSTCHNPHNSPYVGLLVADGDESCFSCHSRDGFARKFSHEPVKKGCETCHVPHSSSYVSLLKQSPDDTCRSCHDEQRQGLAQSHFNFPVESGCILCHSPHSGDGVNLLKPSVHEPVRQGQCSACHGDGPSMELKGAANTLCLTCHTIDTTASMHAPYRDGDCISCHDPHAADYQDLMVSSPETVCLNCHGRDGRVKVVDEQKGTGTEEDSTKPEERPFSMHQPAVTGKCLACHQGHGSKHEVLLRTAPRKLCSNCHEQKKYEANGSHSADKVRGCETCHVPHVSKVRSLLRTGSERTLCESCHRSTKIERGKFSLHKPFAKGQCGECHQLHRPPVKGYLVDQYDNGALCSRCHRQGKDNSEQFVDHDPVVKGQCRKCHSPHATDYEKVLTEPEDTLCYSCHQDVGRQVGRFSVKHQPLVEGKCTSCHTAHGSPYDNILKKNQPVLCLACHAKTAEFWIDGFSHKPAVENCLQCHNAHGADIKGLLVKISGKLCVDCHEVKSTAFVKAHGGMNPGLETCVSCHSSHGSPVKSMLYPVMHVPFAEGTCTPCHPGGKE